MVAAQQEIHTAWAYRAGLNKYPHRRCGRATAAAVGQTRPPWRVILAICESIGRSGPAVRKPHHDSGPLTRLCRLVAALTSVLGGQVLVSGAERTRHILPCGTICSADCRGPDVNGRCSPPGCHQDEALHQPGRVSDCPFGFRGQLAFPGRPRDTPLGPIVRYRSLPVGAGAALPSHDEGALHAQRHAAPAEHFTPQRMMRVPAR